MSKPTENNSIFEQQLLTSTQLQHKLQISERKLDNLIKHDGLPCLRIGRARRFDLRAVLEYLKAQSVVKPRTPRKLGRPRNLTLINRANAQAHRINERGK